MLLCIARNVVDLGEHYTETTNDENGTQGEHLAVSENWLYDKPSGSLNVQTHLNYSTGNQTWQRETMPWSSLKLAAVRSMAAAWRFHHFMGFELAIPEKPGDVNKFKTKDCITCKTCPNLEWCLLAPSLRKPPFKW